MLRNGNVRAGYVFDEGIFGVTRRPRPEILQEDVDPARGTG
jgi:hypothetical protein